MIRQSPVLLVRCSVNRAVEASRILNRHSRYHNPTSMVCLILGGKFRWETTKKVSRKRFDTSAGQLHSIFIYMVVFRNYSISECDVMSSEQSV